MVFYEIHKAMLYICYFCMTEHITDNVLIYRIAAFIKTSVNRLTVSYLIPVSKLISLID